jgi:hypothetical protein
MAELILSRVGARLGARVAPSAFRALGAQLGRAAGSALGARIDDALLGPQRLEGTRLSEFDLQTSTEGASIPITYGRVRTSGEIIWAAYPKEHKRTERVSAGKGASAKATTYQYTLSFAVGLCEGPIARIARVWANGALLDLSQINYRLHTGAEDQARDPLIEAIEGADFAPAYRGLAYVVFEDLPLDAFGNVAPQMSFEIVCPLARDGALEQTIRGVCMIPGSGEFALATVPVRRSSGPGEEKTENSHAAPDVANFIMALDQLQAEAPNLQSIMLVVSWFGADLRMDHCMIKPGVESADKQTRPFMWRAGGVTRSGAHLVSQSGGAPNFGGTPSDDCVLQAIREIKRRGLKVGLCPFVLMDIPPGNGLPDPYGASEQAAFPWRGRISVSPAPGRAGTPDKTSAAANAVQAFFGAASSAHFTRNGDVISYAGPNEWSFRRFILHHAKLADAAGGVDTFLLGSELRGVTSVRSSATHFPAIAALKSLAADVRAMLGPSVKLSYGADWSEYFGHQPQDGTGDVFFHLDPLWADANIDAIGVDWYAPLSDWRDGAGHLDHAAAASIYDMSYLQSLIEGGEGYDWYYANPVARDAQTRTPISDGAAGKPWVFRAKDLRNFWSRTHYDRPGGVEAGAPTAWVAQSKPIWLLELGCPAIDKGANAPNLFVDPKSAESAIPPYSSGARDDLIQRRVLEAYLDYWRDDGGRNPLSSHYSGRMIDTAMTHVWAYDARPYPEFPALSTVWADAPSWRVGHWLNGRLGVAALADVARDLCQKSGLTRFDVSALHGVVSGMILDTPTNARAALEPLLALSFAYAIESNGQLRFRHRADGPVIALTVDEIVETREKRFFTRADDAARARDLHLRFIDGARDYRLASVSAQRREADGAGAVFVDAPLVLDDAAAQSIAQILLADLRAGGERFECALSRQFLALEPGDLISIDGQASAYRIERIEDGLSRHIWASRDSGAAPLSVHAPTPVQMAQPSTPSRPFVAALDLPPLPHDENDERVSVAVLAKPWSGPIDLYLGMDSVQASVRAEAIYPAAIGTLEWALYPGPIGRWDDGNVTRIRFDFGSLSSRTALEVLSGANLMAIERPGEGWEIVSAKSATLVAGGAIEVRDLLRGLQGSEPTSASPSPVGARVVVLDSSIARVNVAPFERGAALKVFASAFGPAHGDAAILDFTPGDIWARPFAPCHVRANRLANGDVQINWVRRARLGGDSWAGLEAPLAEESERYQVAIRHNGVDVRRVEVSAPAWIYPLSDQISDFGAAPTTLQTRIGQISSRYGLGRVQESVLAL